MTGEKVVWFSRSSVLYIAVPGIEFDYLLNVLRNRVVFAVRNEKATAYLHRCLRPATGAFRPSTCHRRPRSLDAAAPGRPAPALRHPDLKSNIPRGADISCVAHMDFVSMVRPLANLLPAGRVKRILASLHEPLPCPADVCWMGAPAASCCWLRVRSLAILGNMNNRWGPSVSSPR